MLIPFRDWLLPFFVLNLPRCFVTKHEATIYIHVMRRTLPKTNLAPENLPGQKERMSSNLSTIIFQG